MYIYIEREVSMYPLTKSYWFEFRNVRKYKSVYWYLILGRSVHFKPFCFCLFLLALLPLTGQGVWAVVGGISDDFPTRGVPLQDGAARFPRRSGKSLPSQSNRAIEPCLYRAVQGVLWTRMFQTSLLTYQYSIEEHTGIVAFPFSSVLRVLTYVFICDILCA